VTIVSFSGIDGAGKSTQISELQLWLRQSGLSTKLVTFWDDVVVLCRLREYMSHRAFKGDQGIGRFFFYFGDALSLAIKVRKLKSSQADVVIFDRYIYDELANLPLKSRLVRAFIWLTLKIVPKPDVSYVVDADPAAAIARKPEYPLDFLYRNRQAYLDLSSLVGNITVIEPASIEVMQGNIRATMLQALPQDGRSPYAEAESIPVNH
jgi:thymidylate kinase